MSGNPSYHMLHFEIYEGEDYTSTQWANGNLSAPGIGKYSRRSDLVDPIHILEEGYKNSF